MIYVEVKNMYEILKDINSPDDVKKIKYGRIESISK